MKRLLILRHAKAERAKKDTPEDSDRPLTDRGRKDARAIGHIMIARGYLPDVVLCSPSKRTRETLELVESETGSGAKVEVPDKLYLATARQILALVRGLPDDVRRPLIIGHNPGLEECAISLIDDASYPKLGPRSESLKEKFPTAALAVVDFRSSKWKDLKPATGTLLDFITPKDLGRN